MNDISVISIDLAKNVFQVCVLNEHQKPIKNVKLSRAKLFQFVINYQPQVVIMEACYSANYWARLFEEAGLAVRLIPAQYVKPFVRGNKNDKNDALAIAEAGQRPNIRFVNVKSLVHQDMQSLHRIRERLLASRLRLSNQVRGLLSEYGITIKQGDKAFRESLLTLKDQTDDRMGDLFRQELGCLYEEYCHYQTRIRRITAQIKQHAEVDEKQRLLTSIPGIGPLIANAVVCSIGNGAQFQSPRDFAVWLGLTPRQYASGQKSYQAGVTKRGNPYLRKQLIHGARAACRWHRHRTDPHSCWINALIARRGYNKAVVALAHKLSRIIWAVLRDCRPYETSLAAA